MINRKKSILLNIIAICITAVFLFPLYWIIINSLKSDAEIFQYPPTFFPKKLTLSPYLGQIVGDYSIFQGLKNSFILSTLGCVIALVLAVPAAYGLARFQIKGSKIMILSFLVTQMLPVTLLLTPLFLIFKNMNVLNTYFAPVIANTTTAIPFVVLILRTYFKKLPRELEDAACIDGCSSFQSFYKIMLPIAQSGLVTAGVFSFLFSWNDLIFSLTFISNQAARPLTAGIYNFIGKYGTQWNNIMAFSTLIVIPVVIIFIFLQKYIVSGLTSGAVKE